MNLQKINQLSREAGYTNYEGDEGNMYTGYQDDFIDFGGKDLDFASEIATDRVFTYTITNATAGTLTALLCPSYSPNTPAGTYPIVEGVMVANFSASGSPKTITNFLAFINVNPTSIIAMKIVSNVSAQLAAVMNIVRKSPFRDLETEQIVLGSYTSEINNNDKMVTVRRPFQMDNQTEISLPIPAGATTSITFYCGAVLNTARALNNKSNRAGRSTAVANTRALVQAQ